MLAPLLLKRRMLTRISPAAPVAAMGWFLLLVVFNKRADDGSNDGFGYQVRSMDPTLPGNHGLWRAIPTPALHPAGYAIIILWEAVACALRPVGAARLRGARQAGAAALNRANDLATGAAGREHRLQLGETRDRRPERAPAPFAWVPAGFGPTGVMGDATLGTREKGGRWLEEMAAGYAGAVLRGGRGARAAGTVPAPDLAAP